MSAKPARQALPDRTVMSLSVETPDAEILVYNYDQIDPDYRQTVIDAAVDIKRNDRRVRDSLITIGKRLQQVKDLLPHKKFGAWIHKEFEMSHRMAQNYMNVYRVYGNKQGETISFLTNTLLIMLAAPGTPEEARAELESEARTTGKSPTTAHANAVIRKAKQPADEAAADAWDATPRADIVFEHAQTPETPTDVAEAGFGIEYHPTARQYRWARHNSAGGASYGPLRDTEAEAVEDARDNVRRGVRFYEPPIPDRNASRRAELQEHLEAHRKLLAMLPRSADLVGLHSLVPAARREIEKFITALENNLEGLH